jgi:hypothetical protein
MSGEHGNKDVEEIYRQERAREAMEEDETGADPGGASGSANCSGTGSGAHGDISTGEDLQERFRNYIAKIKSKKADSNCNSNKKCDVVDPISVAINDPPVSNSTYDAILSLRVKGMEAPSLNGGASTNIGLQLGNFKPSGEVWGPPVVERQIFGVRQNISLNFDPISMLCSSCNNEHRVLSGSGDGFTSNRKIFVLSDQAFPADARAEDGGDCLVIIRLEHGSLNELVELFCEITRGCQVPAGSVLLVASLSHLSDVGFEAYAEDLNQCAIKVGRLFKGGLITLPGLLFPPSIVTCSMIPRYMLELLSWSSTISCVTEGGEPILSRCYTYLRETLIEKGSGNVQAVYSARYRLPDKLGTHTKKKWGSNGYPGLKTGLDPLDQKTVVETLNIALEEISTGLGLKKIHLANLNGGQATGSFSRNVVIVGVSHANRLFNAFKKSGANPILIETPHWKSTADMVSTLCGKLEAALVDLVNPVIVFCMLDNSYFRTTCSDGSIEPNRKGPDGRYHVVGDVLCGPADSAKKMFQQLVPLLMTLADYDKLLLTPIPRYIWKPCCDNSEHSTNVSEPGYLESQLGDLDACHRLWRGLAHRDKIKNLKVCNTGHLVADKLHWGSDPVHPHESGYDLITRYLINGCNDMEGKRKEILDDHLDERPAKAARCDANIPAPPPRFRPAWMSSSGQFVTPTSSRPFSRGRGRPFARGGYRRF